MVLFHFTCREHLPSILSTGLSRGEVPLSPTNVIEAVWFTTSPHSVGHGLGNERRELTDEERAAYVLVNGREPPADVYFANKQEIRIRVKILRSDHKLVYWPTFAKKKVAPKNPKFLAALHRNNNWKTWFLYFGVVSPNQFDAVELCSDAFASDKEKAELLRAVENQPFGAGQA